MAAVIVKNGNNYYRVNNKNKIFSLARNLSSKSIYEDYELIVKNKKVNIFDSCITLQEILSTSFNNDLDAFSKAFNNFDCFITTNTNTNSNLILASSKIVIAISNISPEVSFFAKNFRKPYAKIDVENVSVLEFI